MKNLEWSEVYELYRQRATELAGGLLDIPRRVRLLYQMYDDSLGNHLFPLIAAHGALWAAGYFEIGGAIGRLIARRYFYNSRERAYRLGLLDEFAIGFRKVNRQVCIDTLTNYWFLRDHGDSPEAVRVLPESLVRALRQVHASRVEGRRLGADDRRAIFEQSFRCEQEVTVAPGVAEAIGGFDCRVMQFICLHPLVRFRYFPRWRYLAFRNFGATEERIQRGLQAFELAIRAGDKQVVDSLTQYKIMPLDEIRSPLCDFDHPPAKLTTMLAR